MSIRQRRIRKYAQRKRKGSKPNSLPGGLSYHVRQTLQSISPTKKSVPKHESAPIINYTHRRAKIEKKAERYRRIESILDRLKLKHILKRQAVHAACEEIVRKVWDISEQIIDYEARLAEWKAKYDLLEHPQKYGKEKYAILLKAYGVRDGDTAQAFKTQVLFLERRIKTAEKEHDELLIHTPTAFVKIFGKDVADALWVEVFREHLFSTEHLS